MTKKDYELIARVLRQHTFNNAGRMPDQVLCELMADVLARDNPRFDRERFLTACGVDRVDYMTGWGPSETVIPACPECHMTGSHKMDCSRGR